MKEFGSKSRYYIAESNLEFPTIPHRLAQEMQSSNPYVEILKNMHFLTILAIQKCDYLC